MNRLALVAVLELLLAGCSDTRSPTTPSAPLPESEAHQTEPEEGRGDGPEEREVILQDSSGREELRRLTAGDVFSAWELDSSLSSPPLIYRGEPVITWSVRDDGALIVNDRVVGFDLSGLDERQRQEVLARYRGRLESIEIRDVDRVTPALIALIRDLSGGDLALSLSGSFEGGLRLDLLEGLGPELVGLSIDYQRAEDVVVNLEELPALPHLRAFSFHFGGLWDIRLRGLASLRRFPQLKALLLDETLFGDQELAELRGLPQLRELSISRTSVTAAGLSQLKALPQLRSLALGDIPIEDSGLAHLRGLSQLRALNLYFTQISDAGLEHLKGLSQLRALDLSQTQVGDVGLSHLKGLSELRALNLFYTKCGDPGLSSLKGLSRLRSLNLAITQVSDQGLAHLEGLSQLRSLDLSQTSISDAGLAHLRGLSRLNLLDLSQTSVSGAGLVHLKGLSQLRSLDLDRTPIDDTGLSHLEGLSQLRRLELDGTAVTPSAAKAFQERHPRCDVRGL